MEPHIILLIIVIILLLWYCGCMNVDYFRSCRDCDQEYDPKDNVVLNPFIYPYSGTENTNRINILYARHNFEPDHVEPNSD